MDQWKQSGLSRLAFCQQQQLCYGTFLCWLRDRTAAEVSGFVEVYVEQPRTLKRPESVPEFTLAEVISPRGWRIRLAPNFDSLSIRELLKLIDQCY